MTIDEEALKLLRAFARIKDPETRRRILQLVESALEGKKPNKMLAKSRLPSLSEWHRMPDPVMPVRHDVHRSCGAADRAHEAPADARPGAVLGQGV
jgi:hypothetical protein